MLEPHKERLLEIMGFLVRKKHKKEYLSLYNINPDSKAYVLELSLEDYSEIFNGWDASPLRRKEIEPELMDYFVQAATEIPIRERIEICFYVLSEQKDHDKENKSIAAIKNNFRIQLLFTNRSLRDIYRRFATYIFVSIILLSGAYILPGAIELSLVYKIMVEGMFIAGWWMLWEGCSLFFFNGHDIRLRKRYFERYLKSDIYFRDVKE